jgi:hypothetical protein
VKLRETIGMSSTSWEMYIKTLLVGGAITIWKNMSSSMVGGLSNILYIYYGK